MDSTIRFIGKISATLLLVNLLAVAGIAQNSTLTLRINELPQAYPLLYDTLFFAGDLNEWNPWTQEYALEKQEDGTWEIQLSGPSNTSFSYKITRGYSWDTVEGSSSGSYIPNRTASFNNGVEEITIEGWEDLPTPHSANSNTYILHSGSYMSTLNRHRRVWIWLPENYEDSDLEYPVVYMHDAQNLFDLGTSFVGEWEIDENMAELQESCAPAIIVGIDNGESLRIDEYAPYLNQQYGGGEGAQYLDYIVNDLKPFIDSNFRTLTGPSETAIIGSSLGGLISMYAAKLYPDVFGKIGLFSPAFWFNPELFDFVENASMDEEQQFYFIAGSNESSSMVPLMEQMVNVLIQAGHPISNIFLTDHSDGAHSEWYWAREFPAAFEWFFCTATDVQEIEESDIRIAPNPSDSLVSISFEEGYSNLELVDVSGKVLVSKELIGLKTIEIPVHSIPSGLYILRLADDFGAIQMKRLLIQH